jgi:hypothetical protein
MTQDDGDEQQLGFFGQVMVGGLVVSGLIPGLVTVPLGLLVLPLPGVQLNPDHTWVDTLGLLLMAMVVVAAVVFVVEGVLRKLRFSPLVAEVAPDIIGVVVLVQFFQAILEPVWAAYLGGAVCAAAIAVLVGTVTFLRRRSAKWRGGQDS